MNHYHYYNEHQEDLHSNPNCFDFYFRNQHFKFHTDDGVFSKAYIDYGSFALLSCFEPNNFPEPILDMGAGYGPIGITIAKLYQKTVYFSEINQRAFSLLQKNVLENQITTAHCYQGNLYEALPKEQLYSCIVTNPPIRAGKQVVFDIYKGAFSKLVTGGHLWVVIQKKQGAPSSKEFIKECFGNCEIINRDKGYYILRATKN